MNSDDATAVRRTGQGFLKETGQLKSKEELNRTPEPEKVAAPPQDESATVSKETVIASVGSVQRDFRSQVNKVAATANQAEAVVEEAQAAVKDEIQAAKELKRAFKEGSDDQVEAAKKQLSKAREERSKVADKVAEENKTLRTEGTKSLNFGNEQLGIAKVSPIEFDASSGDAPSSAKEVDAYIAGLREDRKSLSSQRDDIRETRGELRAAVAEVDKRVSAIEDDTIRNFDEAKKSADDIAQRLRQGGQEAFAFNVKDSVVKALFQ